MRGFYITVLILFLGAGGWFAYSRAAGSGRTALTDASITTGGEKTAKSGEKSGTSGNASGNIGGGGPGGKGGPGQAVPPVPVVTVKVQRRDIPIFLDGLGTVQAYRSVTVRSRIDGQISKIHFKEGQTVRKGEMLAEIDARSYQAQLDEALAHKKQNQAKLEQDRAKIRQDEAARARDQSLVAQFKALLAQHQVTLANAKVNLVRLQKSAAMNGVTEQNADDQKAVVAQLEAGILADEAGIKAAEAAILGDDAAIQADKSAVLADEAAIESDEAAIQYARTYLSYATITSPIDGRTGVRLIDEGNLLRANDGTSGGGIVVITQLQPVSVIFSLPQQHLRVIQEKSELGELDVSARDSEKKSEPELGRLALIDNQIEQTTGTIRLKAEFPNLKNRLWPGGFVNTRLHIETLKEAVAVEAPAIQQGPKGTYAYLVKDDQTVEMRLVNVVLYQDGWAVIGDGLVAGDDVVFSGHDKLQSGSKILGKPKGFKGEKDKSEKDKDGVDKKDQSKSK